MMEMICAASSQLTTAAALAAVDRPARRYNGSAPAETAPLNYATSGLYIPDS
jgi:hypothetical protein